MSPRVTELTQAHINRLVEYVEATQTELVREDAPTAPDRITPEDYLSKSLKKELEMYQSIIKEIKVRKEKFTHDTFLVERLNAYRNALIKAREVGSEIVFCVNILR